jgi:hypothetical protein
LSLISSVYLEFSRRAGCFFIQWSIIVGQKARIMQPGNETKVAPDLLVGTWAGISLIAEALVRAGLIEKEAVTAPLTEAAMLARGRRQTPLLALLWFIENLSS